MPVSPTQITNYGELLAAVTAWLDRTDMSETIQLLPILVEAEVNDKRRHRKMIITTTLAGAGGLARVDLPADWLEMENIWQDGYELTYQSPDVLDKLNDNILRGATAPTTPCHYSYSGDTVRVWPTSEEDFEVTVEYYAKVATVTTGTDDANWLLTDHPDLYLYGCLKHSAPFLDDDPRIALWAKLFDDPLSRLGRPAQDPRISGSRLTRIPPVKLG